MFVSQPFAPAASQFAKPALHAPRVQTPLRQLSPAFGRSHAAPHAPQSVSVLILRSQPLSALPSQLAKLAAHVGEQAPATHAVVPLVFTHRAPQAPQFVVVVSGVSQPFDARPSQLPKPELHATEHAPLLHEGAPLLLLHAAPHAPQLVRLE